jgi:predicted MPP superfamily phosphohydrolase
MPLVWFLSILLHAYVALRIVPALAGWSVAAAALALAPAAWAVVLPLGLRTLRRRRRGRDAALLLAHQPRSAPAAAEAGFELQRSGHTHGGQFLPWTCFVRLQQPFTAGLHRLGRLRVHVSRGTGYWGPPKRFGAPSEITRIRLLAA